MTHVSLLGADPARFARVHLRSTDVFNRVADANRAGLPQPIGLVQKTNSKAASSIGSTRRIRQLMSRVDPPGIAVAWVSALSVESFQIQP